MGGGTGQLQRLTDEQVNARLAAYNGDKSLDRDVTLLRDNVNDIISSEIVAQFGSERAERFAANYASTVDADWIQAVAESGRRIYQDKTSVPAYIAERDKLVGRVIGSLFERFAAEPDRLLDCVLAYQRMTTYQTDIMLAQVALLEANEAAEMRGRQTQEFER
jgi:methyl-accepting chemotaxis protein